MTEFVVQKFDYVRGNWVDDVSSFVRPEALILLRDAYREYGLGNARIISRRITH